MAKHDNERLQMYISVTNITIVICWISLLSFWAIKLMGGNWFEVVVTNQNFIAFSNFVQNTWAKYVVSFVTISVVNFFTFGAISQTFVCKGARLIYALFATLSMWVISNFVFIDILQVCYGYITIIIYGVIFNQKFKKTFGLVAILLEFVFLTISMLVRNVELEVTTHYIFSLLLSIDVYLMYALYYLYSNLIKIRKEK